MIADKMVYIGKEADKIESNLGGLNYIDYNIYVSHDKLKTFLSVRWRGVKGYGVSKAHFYWLKRQLKEGKVPKLQERTAKVLEGVL